MRFMTANLVNRTNNEAEDNEKVAEEWEANLVKYEAWLNDNETKLPTAAQKFLNLMCLHDAYLVEWPNARNDTLRIATRTVFNSDDKTMMVGMTYTLDGDLAVSAEKHEGPGFGDSADYYWLYDEFDIDDEGKFVHHILFSNGFELHVKFSQFAWFRASVEEEY